MGSLSRLPMSWSTSGLREAARISRFLPSRRRSCEPSRGIIVFVPRGRSLWIPTSPHPGPFGRLLRAGGGELRGQVSAPEKIVEL